LKHYEEQQKDKLDYLNDRIAEAKLITNGRNDMVGGDRQYLVNKLNQLHQKVDE
jgi:hypothetical protein